jgi:glutamate dehydrogenase
VVGEATWRELIVRALKSRSGQDELPIDDELIDALPQDYRNRYSSGDVRLDLEKLQQALNTHGFTVRLSAPADTPGRMLSAKLCSFSVGVPLYQGVPLLGRLGLSVLDQRSFKIELDGARVLWLQDFEVQIALAAESLEAGILDRLEQAVSRALAGEDEVDDFSRLIADVNLDVRQVNMLRAYAGYMHQIGFPLPREYIASTLFRYRGVTRKLVALFELRFSPEQIEAKGAAVANLREDIRNGLEAVGSSDDDRILRKYLALIDATLRTSYYQRDAAGCPKPCLSLKFDSQVIEGLEVPKPKFEVFVYSARVEGIHLRAGSVARGGIRWSDRLQDYRTEILGLLKAQMVKNVVIVPQGAKGGFVVKRRPPGADPDAVRAEGVECYKLFIGGLLDVTDNIRDGQVVPPERSVRYDGDDPYLVVAADKGTATFSDFANEISQKYRFWLGDAFASGGSSGYDHKKLGITAQGAWESVKRHFRELDSSVKQNAITAIGIGDMSGDVFGNGMLLSKQMKLLGAFDHRHVFIDPNPDPELSWAERKRLFELPGSSWLDYERTALSEGGEVFDRRVKRVTVSRPIQQLLGLPGTETTPPELIQALLRAPVDLLWLGGIGTYVKAADEQDEDVKDRANDLVRVKANELRCRIIGEGANLGITQKGRIEYARHGGRLNTDAIDNAAGVNCSDHEVNLKILLNSLVDAGRIASAERDRLLLEMTDEVVALVLRDNYLQSQALSAAETRACRDLDRHRRLIRLLERQGLLDRRLADLPDEETIAERALAGTGLTRPELAVLLAYTKMSLHRAILPSDLPDGPLLEVDLLDYFPSAIRRRFASDILSHPLRREIIATSVVNSMVNRVGSGFVSDVEERTGASDAEVASAYAVARDLFGAETTWFGIESLDDRVPAKLQLSMLLELRELLEQATLWLLRHVVRPIDVLAAVGRYHEGVTMLREGAHKWLAEEQRTDLAKRIAELTAAGVGRELAEAISNTRVLKSALDIVELAGRYRCPVERACLSYFLIGEALSVESVRTMVADLRAEERWDLLALTAVHEEIAEAHRAIVANVLESAQLGSPHTLVADWLGRRQQQLERLASLFDEIQRTATIKLPMLVAIGREFRSLALAA